MLLFHMCVENTNINVSQRPGGVVAANRAKCSICVEKEFKSIPLLKIIRAMK